MDTGYTVKFGSRSVTFYPLNLKAIRELEGELHKLTGIDRASAMEGGEALLAALKVLTASARRGEPSITAADVEEVIDLGNINQVMDALLGASGFKRTDGDPGGPTSPRTGGESTPASSAEPAGAGPTSTT